MLLIIAEIIFYRTERTDPNKKGYSTKYILRPAFNFGRNLLFSGSIKNTSNVEVYLYNEKYEVDVEFPTIEDEAYEFVQPLLEIGKLITIQNASLVIGEAVILSFEYSYWNCLSKESRNNSLDSLDKTKNIPLLKLWRNRIKNTQMNKLVDFDNWIID